MGKPIFWSRKGIYRFDSAGAPFGVLYSACNLTTAILEVFGDKLRRTPRLTISEIERYDIYAVRVSEDAQTVALEGPNLAQIGATLGSFAGSYPLSQKWGLALMQHRAEIDGLVYLGRRSGDHCLALFGDEKKPKKHQAKLRVSKIGPLVDSLEFWQFVDRLKVAVLPLPL